MVAAPPVAPVPPPRACESITMDFSGKRIGVGTVRIPLNGHLSAKQKTMHKRDWPTEIESDYKWNFDETREVVLQSLWDPNKNACTETVDELVARYGDAVHGLPVVKSSDLVRIQVTRAGYNFEFGGTASGGGYIFWRKGQKPTTPVYDQWRDSIQVPLASLNAVDDGEPNPSTVRAVVDTARSRYKQLIVKAPPMQILNPEERLKWADTVRLDYGLPGDFWHEFACNNEHAQRVLSEQGRLGGKPISLRTDQMAMGDYNLGGLGVLYGQCGFIDDQTSCEKIADGGRLSGPGVCGINRFTGNGEEGRSWGIEEFGNQDQCYREWCGWTFLPIRND